MFALRSPYQLTCFLIKGSSFLVEKPQVHRPWPSRIFTDNSARLSWSKTDAMVMGVSSFGLCEEGEQNL